MGAVTTQAFTLHDWLVGAAHPWFILTLVMAVETDPGRRFCQQAGILAGMWSMAALAVASPDRFMFRCSGDVIMTGQANSSFESLQADDAAVDLMTFVAVTATRWRVNNFPEQTGVSGTVLSMAVDASRIDRITLVRPNKSGIGCIMAGSTQIGACQVQQARVV